MKLYAETPKGIDLLGAVEPPPEEQSTLTSLSAILRTENDIAMQADKLHYFTDYGSPEKDYNPYASGLIPDDMDQFWEEFKGDHNRNQTSLTVGRLRHLQENRATREKASMMESFLGYGVAGMGSSTTIPFMLMPAGMLFEGGVALKGAMNIGKSALQVAGYGAVEESLAEYIRHGLDPNRTMGESYAAVASVSLFGGALGGLGAKMTNSSYARALRDMEDLKSAERAATEEGGLKRWLANEEDSAGAMRVAPTEETPERLGWISSNLLGGGLFPGVRLLRSPAKSVRRITDKLINHAFGTKTSSAENNIRRTEMVARARTRIIGIDGYKRALKDGYVGKEDQFWEQVGEALIHKDRHISDDKYVAEVAAKLREEIIDPIKVKFQKLGDLPEEFETKFADSYFPRLYRTEVLKESAKYTDILKNHLLEVDAKKGGDLSDAEALELANDYMQKIESWDVSKLPQGVGSTGRLKERGIDLYDSDLQRLGFLEKNALVVMDKYINSIVPEMEIKLAFGGLERAAEMKGAKKTFEENVERLKREFEERLKDPKALREQTREEIEIDYEDYLYFAKEEYQAEKDGIRDIYKGRMQDAEIVYDNLRKEVQDRFAPQRLELENKSEVAHTARRTQRDNEIAKTQAEFESIEAILRKDFDNLKPKNELERVKAQKKLEDKIRAARKVRDGQQTKIKNADSRNEKAIRKAYAESKAKVDSQLDDALAPHTKAFEDAKHEAQLKKDAASREARTAYENSKTRLMKERDRDYAKAQKEKIGSEQALRRQKRQTLKQQKINLKKKLKEEAGQAHHLSRELKEVEDEYNELIKQATTQKEIDRLKKLKDSDANDIMAMRDRLLGIYKRPAKDIKLATNIGQSLRTWSYLAYMGFMTIASLPDMARAIMKHGAGAAWKGFRGGFPSFIKGLDAGSAIQRKALNDMGLCVDALLSSRALMMGEIGDLTGFNKLLTKGFTKITLMNRWNDSLKHLAAISAQHRFLNEIKNFDSLSAKRKLQLKEHGFDEDMIDRIRSESSSFSTVKGALMANTNDWIDKQAAEHFEKMVLRDTEIAIVTPGAGDSPLLMSNDAAKLVFQFKTFFLASHTRAFLPMIRQMSRGDANAFMGFMVQTTIGAFMVEPLRLAASGRLDEIDEMNWQDWAYAGLDRSGVATIPMELANLTDKLMQGSISELIGLRNSRYNQRGISVTGGPALGLAENFLRMPYDIGTSTIGDADWTERKSARIRSMLPAQNLFYTRWLVNMAEDAANDALGAKETKR